MGKRVQLSWVDPGSGDSQTAIVPLPATLGRVAENDLVLKSERVSSRAAQLVWRDEQVYVEALGEAGVRVNGILQLVAPLKDGDYLRLGPFDFVVQVLSSVVDLGQQALGAEQSTIVFEQARTLSTSQMLLPPEDMPTHLFGAEGEADNGETVLFSHTEAGYLFNEQTDELEPATVYLTQAPALMPFPPPLFNEAVIHYRDLEVVGIAIETTTYVSLGGGLGSFAWADVLRIQGVATSQLRVLGLKKRPHSRYQELARHSRIPDHERLRSDSGSTMDNIWGWPGYAVREAGEALRAGAWREALGLGWRIFTEPVLTNVYTPRADMVYASIEAEMERIGWDEMWQYGRVKGVRKLADGRYVIAYIGEGTEDDLGYRFLVADYVHIAFGYPGLQFLRDLQTYRARTGDTRQVVNAYEGHEQVYEQLRAEGGVVVLRGRGIVASRILQNLHELRSEGAEIKVLHLHRTPKEEGQSYGRTKRMVAHHWELQLYDWPKDCFGGHYRQLLEEGDDEERERLLNEWGGTTTAARPDWLALVEEGQVSGWYEQYFGIVTEVVAVADKVVTKVKPYAGDEVIALEADFVIDATGLHARIDSHPVMKDLLDIYGLRRNSKGRLWVQPDFEVPGMQNRVGERVGRLYVTGAMTFGGPFAPVDSFLGLQYGALRAADSLAAVGAPSVRRLRPWRSAQQWWRWWQGVAP
ncbi:MAG TPA: FHA domain-containing protein [Anaerolineae bacterium]|nr:FHA domain-containing protein [Anaerolineae bacterium]